MEDINSEKKTTEHCGAISASYYNTSVCKNQDKCQSGQGTIIVDVHVNVYHKQQTWQSSNEVVDDFASKSILGSLNLQRFYCRVSVKSRTRHQPLTTYAMYHAYIYNISNWRVFHCLLTQVWGQHSATNISSNYFLQTLQRECNIYETEWHNTLVVLFILNNFIIAYSIFYSISPYFILSDYPVLGTYNNRILCISLSFFRFFFFLLFFSFSFSFYNSNVFHQFFSFLSFPPSNILSIFIWFYLSLFLFPTCTSFFYPNIYLSFHISLSIFFLKYYFLFSLLNSTTPPPPTHPPIPTTPKVWYLGIPYFCRGVPRCSQPPSPDRHTQPVEKSPDCQDWLETVTL